MRALNQLQISAILGLAIGTSVGCKAPLDSYPSYAKTYIESGPYLGPDDSLDGTQLCADVERADRFKKSFFPSGYVTVFGSSRINESGGSVASVRQSNAELYAGIREFSKSWTTNFGSRIPIMTGGGPGVMEAASRGAMEAGGPSVGYTTYYGDARVTRNPNLAFQTIVGADGSTNAIISHGLVFSSVSLRETMMILHSAAIVIAPGGTGTEWETYQVLEMLKSKQLTSIPVFIVGPRSAYWTSLYDRIADMEKRRVVNPNEVQSQFKLIEKYSELMPELVHALKLAAPY